MRLLHRVQQLERAKGPASPPTPLERLHRALDAASIRTTGRRYDQISGDEGAVNLVMEDLGQSFIRELADAELATLIAESERLAFGTDTEALKAAEREVLASLDAEACCAGSGSGG
ncbi:MAG: hypothetical protein JWP63_4666 [Candidatus Solibacter sp.]|jgi:hypothetical protein|nr:hypothetical protein [Candidatus Solibacter sp.]